jgi:predicted Ser/Thr protein kinase
MFLCFLHESVSLSISIDREKVLGKGAYGIVYEGTWRGSKMAVKRIQIENVQNNKGGEEPLQILDHPNVVKLYDVDSNLDFKY